MPTQKQIAEHLDLSQPSVSEIMGKLNIDWQSGSLEQIRVAYIRHLRGQAAGHRTEEGLDLVRERVMTERVDRELKLLQVAEKKGALVNVGQLGGELVNMVGAFRTELLARDDKLKEDLDALYEIEVDLAMLNEHTYAALSQLARYDPGGAGVVASPSQHPDAAGTSHDHGMVTAVQAAVSQGIGEAGAI